MSDFTESALFAECRLLKSQLAAALAKVAELEQELADVHVLDEWTGGDAGQRCGLMNSPPGAPWGVRISSYKHPHVKDFFGDTPVAARRAAVEYLASKENK